MPTPIPAYAELHCLSNFTFLRGASHPEEMIERAHELGYEAIAITDECSFAGVVRAHVAAKEVGTVKLIIGSEFTLEADPERPALGRFRLLVLCCNRNGYGNLGEVITDGRRRVEKGRYQLSALDFEQGLTDCLVLLLPSHDTPEAELMAQSRWLAEQFGQRAWIAVELLHRLDDFDHLQRLRRVSAGTGVALVASGNVHMHVRSRKPLQDTLTAIRLRQSVDACGYALMPNAEAHLRPRLRLARLYDADLLEQSVVIARRCNFSLDELRYEYPQELVPAGHSPASHLRALTVRGARKRYPHGLPPKVLKQLRHELQLIREFDYERFFLTVEDIVRFARGRGILCQGRGSAANSAVCFCLDITEVRPEEGNLLFERFISRARNEPPDIDVDFEHQRREEVIQYIYNKYGRHRTALAATVIRYRPRSAVRDVGKALGIDASEVDRLAKSHQWWDGRNVNRARLAESGFDPGSAVVKLWAEITDTLIGFPRHLSQHVGGFVIAADKLARLVPIENASMPNRSVIEWDKDDLDALRLLKVDVLALGMLSVIRRSLEFIGAKQSRQLMVGDVPSDCKRTWSMIQQADTIGVFQIESRAQMSMLPRLKPDKFYDLVIEVAIVRPGPIQGGMVHPYLRRKQGLEDHTLPKEELKVALERTLGVPIFQEQVMQIAMIAAKFSADEADQLRRAMAAWRRKGGLESFHARLVGTMIQRGYEPAFAEAIFKQTQGFGEYGFPESHAAGFAKLAWISSWIKCHHPDAFLAALLNSQPMGFYGPSQLVQDAQRHGVVVLPIDVSCSDWTSTLSAAAHGDAGWRAVRLGLDRTGGLKEKDGLRIVEERALRGPFASIEDLARRCDLDQHALQSLAGANALLGLSGHRRQAHWQVAAIKPMPRLLDDARFNETPLQLPMASEGQEIVADYRATGLTLGRHPLALLRKRLAPMRLKTAEELNTYPDGRLARACGIVTVRQRPGTAKGTIFVTIEDETGPVNIIVWPDLVERQPRELLGSSLLAVYGVWQNQSGVRHLVARRFADLSAMLGDLRAASRNFH
ncbi:error-prone DNA polymerase [soil metagenome]